jgi:hypothetical protein
MVSGRTTGADEGGFVVIIAAGVDSAVRASESERDAAEQPRKPHNSERVAVRKDNTRGRDNAAMRAITVAGGVGSSSRKRDCGENQSAVMRIRCKPTRLQESRSSSKHGTNAAHQKSRGFTFRLFKGISGRRDGVYLPAVV